MSDEPNVDRATAKFMADQWSSAIEAREAMAVEIAQLKAERDRLREALERIKARVLIHSSSEARDVFLVAEEALAATEPSNE